MVSLICGIILVGNSPIISKYGNNYKRLLVRYDLVFAKRCFMEEFDGKDIE